MSSETLYVLKAGKHVRTLRTFPSTHDQYMIKSPLLGIPCKRWNRRTKSKKQNQIQIKWQQTTNKAFFSRLTLDFYLESRLESEERSGGWAEIYITFSNYRIISHLLVFEERLQHEKSYGWLKNNMLNKMHLLVRWLRIIK